MILDNIVILNKETEMHGIKVQANQNMTLGKLSLEDFKELVRREQNSKGKKYHVFGEKCNIKDTNILYHYPEFLIFVAFERLGDPDYVYHNNMEQYIAGFVYGETVYLASARCEG